VRLEDPGGVEPLARGLKARCPTVSGLNAPGPSQGWRRPAAPFGDGVGHGDLRFALMVLPHGIEPRSSGYRPGALPLSYGRDDCAWCTREDLNLHALARPLLRRRRLPFRHECMMVRNGGSNGGFRLTKAVPCLSSGCKSHPATAPAGSNRSSYGGAGRLRPFTVVLAGGLEPPASRLQGECSAR
jgi:hypothetical protein